MPIAIGTIFYTVRGTLFDRVYSVVQGVHSTEKWAAEKVVGNDDQRKEVENNEDGRNSFDTRRGNTQIF